MSNRKIVKVADEYWVKVFQRLDRHKVAELNVELVRDTSIERDTRMWTIRNELNEIAKATGFKTVYTLVRGYLPQIEEREVGIAELPILLRARKCMSFYESLTECKEAKIKILATKSEYQIERIEKLQKELEIEAERLKSLQKEIKNTKGFSGTFEKLREKKQQQ